MDELNSCNCEDNAARPDNCQCLVFNRLGYREDGCGIDEELEFHNKAKNIHEDLRTNNAKY